MVANGGLNQDHRELLLSEAMERPEFSGTEPHRMQSFSTTIAEDDDEINTTFPPSGVYIKGETRVKSKGVAVLGTAKLEPIQTNQSVTSSRKAVVDICSPVPLARPTLRSNHSYGFSFGGPAYGRSTEEDICFCARSSRNKRSTTFMAVDASGKLSMVRTHTATNLKQHKDKDNGYIVVGMIDKDGCMPRETLLRISKREDLFHQIRKAERKLRSPLHRLLSLKRVAGFGIYQCHPHRDYHTIPEVSVQTQRCLIELFRNYHAERLDHKDRWMTWIHCNFNNSSCDPQDGVYALQLLLHWSPVKLMIWSGGPIVLSMALGLWYTFMPHPGESPVAVLQTAWTLASYIVTTAALALAIVASITQLGDH